MSRYGNPVNMASVKPKPKTPYKLRGEFEELDNGYLITVYNPDAEAARVFAKDLEEMAVVLLAESAKRKLGA